ncbi:MAG TPA: glycosyltransferase [Tepidisphaeraceae bacterium]|nr:glycosyltransferase [Tepidisphaeraceae bacterium]
MPSATLDATNKALALPMTFSPVQPAAVSRGNGGRQRQVQIPTDRVRRDGKFFRLGAEKFYVKGVTYGPFAPNIEGLFLPEREHVRWDFEQVRRLGANCLRIYHLPPEWFMDLAAQMGLKIFLDVSWPKNLTFIGDPEVAGQARAAVREAARECGRHPAVFAISVVNEIPPDIVRFCGERKIEEFIDELVTLGKAEAPDCLFTFANFPTTEYLRPRKLDFVCFNVYLHEEKAFRNYLARLQMIAGELPLMLGEYGIDTFREYSDENQAKILETQVRAVYDEGAVGIFVFSFTDDWFVHGWQIEDWAFGLTRRQRDDAGYRVAKPAFAAVRDVFEKAPQGAIGVKLPKMSVVICSYNGASTVESCLASMRKLRYPDFEVIFVDDGSTDGTQEILAGFPEVINIRQRNMGLSHARNVGMNAATGDVVVYTDSDCEADEDWLYFLALALVRSGHAGMGGPNLIPDEGSWVADCVGLSPGGPTHVMVDDRTAEHVPGCNMAFYTAVLKQINGFDPQYRKAGDDVDVIWRLQNLGYSIGFAPAAQVWHYRRNTIKAYLKQQRGYGEAEALLKYKHPEHFNSLGASHWRGKIYGAEDLGIRIGGNVIYHGLFGTGLFQTIYRRPASLLVMLMTSIEWHLLAGFVTVLGLAFTPMLWVALLMFLTPIFWAAVAGAHAPRPRHSHWLSRPLIAWLHYRQPIVRGWARYSVRLKNKVMIMRKEARGYQREHRLPFDAHDPNTLRYWSEEHGRFALLDKITEEVRTAGWRYRLDSGWNGWDIEIYASRYVNLQITTATEHHSGTGRLTRVRVKPMMSNFCRMLTLGSVVLGGVLLLDLYPLSRIAVLLPLTVWAMYVINRWRVSNPVLGMIDEVAEKTGFYPVFPSKPARKKKVVKPRLRPAHKPRQSEHAGLDGIEMDEGEPSVA